MEVTNIDLGGVVVKDAEFRDELLTFASATTMPEGTLLARSTTKLIPYVKGTNTPIGLLTYDVTALAAGDVSVRAMVGGVVNKARLVIAADGDASNVDASVLDELQAVGILAEDVTELNIYDNQ